MDAIIEWFKNNTWFFSGLGVASIAWIGRYFYKKRQASSLQKIRSGNNSTNIQAGRDVKLNSILKCDNADEE